MTTVLITGASSGIGLGLAKAFLAKGTTVVTATRTASNLDGALNIILDVDDPQSIAAAAREVEQRFPTLNLVINNAGIQRVLDFNQAPLAVEQLEAEIRTNFTGAILVANAFLPLLRRQPKARLVNVSSALAFVPLAQTPVYCATKAALHSFTVSLRAQLKATNVEVVELIPPLVETNLHRGQSRKTPGAMPLDAFIEASMSALESGRTEVPIGRAKFLRFAARWLPGTAFNLINKA